MNKVILVRGPSGVGKSTYVRRLLHERGKELVEAVVCSADDFFVQSMVTVGGGSYQEYQFDPTKLPEAHAKCYGDFLRAIARGCELDIVDNTFIRLWSMGNYVQSAQMVGYDIEVHEFRVETIDQLRVCIRRNVHKVPAEIVAKMAVEFEPFEGAVVLPV